MQVYVLEWMFSQQMNSSRDNATVLALVHLHPFGDSPRSVEVSRQTLSVLSAHTAADWPCFVWLHENVRDRQTERGKHRASARETVREVEAACLFTTVKTTCLPFPLHTPLEIHSLGMSYVYLKTSWLASYASLSLFLLLTHVSHLLDHCVHCLCGGSGSFSLTKPDSTKRSCSTVC